MTTDTAVLVSHEILEGEKDIDSLAFTDDPEVPMDETVEYSLDNILPLANLEQHPQAKPFDFAELKTQLANTALPAFSSSIAEKYANSSGEAPQAAYDPEQDVNREESTVMEGFRYRINNTIYPVFKEGKKLTQFPIIPIGMMDVWREDEGDFCDFDELNK